jgi:hypothetical protein
MPGTARAATKKAPTRNAKTRANPSAKTLKKKTPLKSPRPVKVQICVDFSTYPDNTPLGPTYLQAGFTFTQLGPTPVMFANATAGQIGLQFPDAGLGIKLPAPTRRVTMLFGTFGGAVTLETRSGATLVSTQTINTANTYQNIVVNTPAPFSSLIFKRGHNEAILVRICVVYVI